MFLLQCHFWVTWTAILFAINYRISYFYVAACFQLVPTHTSRDTMVHYVSDVSSLDHILPLNLRTEKYFKREGKYRVNTANYILPAHACVLQWFVCWDGPGHCFPPPEGAGLSQVLRLYCEPPPQLLEHWLYCSHGDQWPSTEGINQLLSMN